LLPVHLWCIVRTELRRSRTGSCAIHADNYSGSFKALVMGHPEFLRAWHRHLKERRSVLERWQAADAHVGGGSTATADPRADAPRVREQPAAGTSRRLGTSSLSKSSRPSLPNLAAYVKKVMESNGLKRGTVNRAGGPDSHTLDRLFGGHGMNDEDRLRDKLRNAFTHLGISVDLPND
jgi:hypothetical protein